MFVFSLKASKPKLVIVLCILFVFLAVTAMFINNKKGTAANSGGINYKASDSNERITFLSQFGWKINEEPVEVSEIIIPSEFNQTYELYNEIQKNQDLDLEVYKGVRAKKWVYQVKNYPGYTEEYDYIRATLIIYNDMVIAGDISSVEKNGFMQGFEYPDNELMATEQENSSSAEAAQ